MQEESTLDNLFREVRIAAKRTAARKGTDKPTPVTATQSVWAFPDHWRLLRYVTLITLPANTVLGVYEKWQHVKHPDAIRYVRTEKEFQCSCVVETVREEPMPSFSCDFHKHKEVTCNLHFYKLAVKPRVCRVDLHYAYGKLTEVTLLEPATFVALGDAGFLSLPAGVNVYPTLSQAFIEELQRELHDY
jgi:hypothetical protein